MDQKALYNIGYGLYVLTAKDGEKNNGCIVNTVMQVTSNPLVIVIGVNKQNYTHDMIVNTKEFNLSILTKDVPFAVFQHFGFQSGRTVEKLAEYEHHSIGENGLAYLSRYTNAYLSCRVMEVMDFGSHSLFKAEVKDARTLSQDDSVTYAYYQKQIKPKPSGDKKSGWRCNICGFVYEGETLPPDYNCPICKHGASDFSKI